MKLLLLLRMFLYRELLLDDDDEEKEEVDVLPLQLLEELDLDGSTALSLFLPCNRLLLFLSVSSSES